ncbi:hypothetical protein OZX67_03110 [Bifidobacterium sp. ESL0728]|uniref:hypothetical protein n=1 Tax=Bifidobacterium sp. ESL0728 TaxID=2983220 RepID=UPI0023F8821A|nr:hypothetical protein [Bifidobacterium sp. ESL0728]WEV59548.1 hypothetical protein OZX67_03110 [Bifidobacterium sp. ESL0728]
MTIISPISWVQEAFKEYFDKAHMTDSSHWHDASAQTENNGQKTSRNPSHTRFEAQPDRENRADLPDTFSRKTKPETSTTKQTQSENLVDNWTATYDYGFEPARGIENGNAVWITPDLLIANNAWRARHNLPSLLFEAPAADWLARLPQELTQRSVITLPVSQIRAWNELPDGLGERPWSQLSSGRVPEFRAARRTLHQLKLDLKQAPDESLITISSHVDCITEEWCVIVGGDKAVASSGYCVHRSADEDSHDILTVFDGARFHDSYRLIAESLAAKAAQAVHLDNASIIVGFRESRGTADNAGDAEPSNMNLQSLQYPKAATQPVIIEADPIWCTTPYPFETAKEANAFLKAISDSRIYETDDGMFKKRNGQSVMEADAYAPDPWMVRHAAHRYDRF